MDVPHVTVVGAAAVFDHIYGVERLPRPGEISLVQRLDARGGPYCGGSAPTIACSLARLGVPAHLIYPVGGDFAGSICEQSWRALDVDLSGIVTAPNEPSGAAWLYSQADGTSMCFADPGASAAAEFPTGAPLHSWVVVAPVFNRFTTAALDQALEQGTRVVVSGIGSPALIPYLARLRALVINVTEAAALCDSIGMTDARVLSADNPALLLYVTAGARGSTVYRDGQSAEIPAVRAERVLDPTGAGDAYSAGVVAGLLRELSPEAAARIGAANASFAVESVGAQTRLPTWDALMERAALTPGPSPGGRGEEDRQESDEAPALGKGST